MVADRISALERKLAPKIDIVLKLTIILCACAASASAGYYYLVLLPRRDAQLVLERRLERAGMEALRREEGARAEAARSAERERILSERRALEERAAVRKAAAQKQYESCLEHVQESYAASWAAACKRIAAQASKDYSECISSMALSKEVCAKTYPDHVVSATCALPPSVKADLTTNVTKAREACLQESKAVVP